VCGDGRIAFAKEIYETLILISGAETPDSKTLLFQSYLDVVCGRRKLKKVGKALEYTIAQRVNVTELMAGRHIVFILNQWR
jgi:hypothetical protein